MTLERVSMGQRAWRMGVVVAVWLGACGGGQERDPTTSETTPLGTESLGSTGIDTLGDAGDELKLDLLPDDPTGNGDDGGVAEGCEKVDLLFVIDNSGSMEDEQANLVASFPGFIAAMRDILADTQGYNVGVISTDVYTGDTTCLPLTEGILITQTAGNGASNAVCAPYASGKRYMTEDDDLETKFACAAQIGISGDGNERPMAALQAALSPGLTGPGGCNEGFLREDALLVVVIITDEEDDHEIDGCMQNPQPGSPGEPSLWFDTVISSKGGDESKIVVLSLVGPSDQDECPKLDKCTGGIQGAEVATRIIEFTEMFTYGFVGPVCEPYGPFFAEAIGVIKSACDEFVPPG